MTVALPLRPLGRTAFRVSPICVGCAPIGDMAEAFGYSVAEEQALATLRLALAGPFNFLDTSAIYGIGESERRIGLVLRELGGLPDGVVLATKADRDPGSGDFGGEQVRRSVRGSLARLGVPRLQLVYLHDPENAPFREVVGPGGALEALIQLRDEGAIEHLGVAGGPIPMLIDYLELGVFEVVITHHRYTLLNRSADRLIRYASERRVAVMNAAPYASGILAKGARVAARYHYQDPDPAVLARVGEIEAICATFGVPVAAAALQFSLRNPGITSTIVGMTRPERVGQTHDLANLHIPEALWTRLDGVALAHDPHVLD